MAEYCSVADVKQAAASWDELGGSGEDAIPDTLITLAIEEASEQVRNDIQPRYTVAQIDALSPTFPPGIVDLTKYRAVLLIIQQYGQVTDQQWKVMRPPMLSLMKPLRDSLQYGTLLDTSGVLVPVASPTAIVSQQTFAKGVDPLYASGTRQYS